MNRWKAMQVTLRRLRRTLASLFSSRASSRADSDMDAEMGSHIELLTQANIESGMTPEEARYAALRKFGWTESIQETCREQRGMRWLENLVQDIRYGIRQLRKNPGFAVVAVFTLALGIGANTAVFSVAKTVLLRSLGFENEDRLFWTKLVNTQTGAMEHRLSWRDMEDIRESAKTVESIGTFGSSDILWDDGNQVTEVSALSVTHQLPDLLGLKLLAGRWFLPSDVTDDGGSVVLISAELWHSRFGGSAAVLGQSVRLNQRVRTIIGVLPLGLEFPMDQVPASGTGTLLKSSRQSFWLPMSDPQLSDRIARDARMFLSVGRLKPGGTEREARAELATLGQRLAIAFPETNRHWGLDLVSFRDQILGRTRKGIPMLAAAVAAVLVICCVNLANLLLARGLTRHQEFSVRLALGAGRGRLFQTLMCENLLISLAGGVVGIALATFALQLVKALAASSVPFISEATIDGATVLFAVGIAILTTMIFGGMPAIRLSQVLATDAMRTGPRSTTGPHVQAWQTGFLVSQTTVVLVLLMAGGLLLESFRRLIGQDLGYHPGSVVALDLNLNTVGFETNGDVCRMYKLLRERLAALPGVEAVGSISSTPLTGKWTFSERPDVVGRSVPEADRPALEATMVAFDYFQAMGIPLREGRFFRDSEMRDDGYGQVVILNEVAAKLLFPSRSAVGGQFTVGSNPDSILEVVGVVADTRDVRLEEAPRPRFYWQYAFNGAQLMVRSKTDPSALMPRLRATILQTDSRVRIDSMRSMSAIVSSTVAERRFLTSMVVGYSAVALGIAMVGIFSVVAYQVAQRTNEFGIRLALGAQPLGLVRLVLVRAGYLAAIGVSVGLLVSLVTNRLLASQLFGVSPYDPWLMVVASLVVLIGSLVASAFPALKVTRVDPIVALRVE